MAETGQQPRSPVPAFTLQISKKDGERIVEASEALKAQLSKSCGAAAAVTKSNEIASGEALHEQVYAAAKQCDHPLIVQFLERISTASLSEKEMKGATLLFDDSNKAAKLRQLFALLASFPGSAAKKTEPLLDHAGAVSLFRTVLMAISSCLQTSEQQQPSSNGMKDVIVEGKPAALPLERPFKRAKLQHSSDATASTKDVTEEGSNAPFQSPSWDSSLATLRDEDDQSFVGMRKEIEEIATFAASELVKHASSSSSREEKKESDERVDFATFGNWYNAHGTSLAPWIELLQLSKWKAPPKQQKSKGSAPAAAKTESRDSSPGSLSTEDGHSRTLVSFDFNGSGSPTPLLINISEDNLHALKALVERTNLMQRTAADICKTLLHAACPRSLNGKEYMVLQKEDFRRTIRVIFPEYVFAQLTKDEQSTFCDSLFDFFSCFEQGRPALHEGEVDAKEFAVGFCFFCSGNKSTKLAVGYELLDTKRRGYLTEDQLLRYLQSYLTMLVGMSLLTPIHKRRRPLAPERRKTMRAAIESGAKWTLGHFLKASGQTKNEYTFECFASWYSSGGYNIAPWLELLDLTKVLSLIAEPSSPIGLPPLETNKAFLTTERRPRPRDRVSSLRRHHLTRRAPPEILFTFPLGNRRSLVVLKEDAIYVRACVEQLGLLTMKPDDLWSQLSSEVEKSRKPTTRPEPAVYVTMETFVRIMLNICPRSNRKRSAPGDALQTLSSSPEELLRNFFQCFDIDQVDSVALDELMGGLTLLCGGKKSHKLAFAFSIFDTRPGVAKKKGITHSLSGEDLFLFLRSVLIVTFSTCRQSLDLTDDMVGRCIADTANMICNDVMRHQWETKRMDRLDFDEFGQWYNDGGFERAPWLELLDLNKWVLLDDMNMMEKQMGPPPPPHHHPAVMPPPPIASVPSREMPILPDASVPPPPPEDSLDHSFFDTDAIMNIDSMDEMDMILMQNSHDREEFPKIAKSFSYGHSPRQQQPPQPQSHRRGNPLKFHLHTTEEHGGYMLSLSQARIRHFRRILEASGLHEVDSEKACNEILAKGRSKITRIEFDAALRNMLPAKNHDRSNDRLIADIFAGIFAAFDRKGTGEANALEVACGFTVLCRGKKSDKLEFAFEVLEKNKRGKLSQSDMASYLQSFLSVLLSIAFSPALDNDPVDDSLATMNGDRCDRSTKTLIRGVKAGAEWAASLAFRDRQAPTMSFDDFADWYTGVGYSSIPWLELLDLQKWAMLPENK